jgi:DNA-binding CsgD family transcriptional regulator
MTESANRKNKGGRPKTVLTQEQIDEVELLARYLTIEQIADHLGIGEKTFFSIRERQTEVLTAYKKGKANAIVDIGNSLYAKARDGDTTSQIFYLKTQAGWSEKQYFDVTSNTPITLPSINLNVSNRLNISNRQAANEGDNELGD